MPSARSSLGSDFGSVRVIRTVGGSVITERSDIASVLISACFEGAAATISARLGMNLPDGPGPIMQADGLAFIWLSPRSWIVQCTLSDEKELTARIEAAFPDRSVHASLFADYLCWAEIRGPDAVTLLRRSAFLSLDQPDIGIGAAKRTLVAEVNAIVVRPEHDRYLLGVERGRARYFVDWLSLGGSER